jgi:hypothetical protein
MIIYLVTLFIKLMMIFVPLMGILILIFWGVHIVQNWGNLSRYRWYPIKKSK